jgi:hypothetical protein
MDIVWYSGFNDSNQPWTWWMRLVFAGGVVWAILTDIRLGASKKHHSA